jgi:starch-binding outer membrane protein, SusD/RagB family
MKNRIIRNTLYVLAGFVLFPSCNKYLEKEPDNRANLSTPEKVSQLLATAYPAANYIPFIETYTDNVGDLGSGDAGSADLNVTNADAFFFRDTRSINEDTPEFYWFACYHAIAACNEALETISKAPNQNDYVHQRAEALVARAYAHFMLVNIFSKFYDQATAASDPGIPYVTEPEKNFIKQYSRGTVASVYDQIEKDLLEALPYIDDKAYKVPKYHFNRAAVNAFVSRFYLYKKDYNKVIQYASQAVPNNFASNLRPWNTEYSAIGLNEIAPRYAKATENANLLLAETSSYWFRTNIAARYALSPAVRDQILREVPAAGGQWAFATGFYVDNHIIVPKIYEYFVTVSVNAEIGNGFVMVPLFTVEEVLFNLAEAYTYTGQLGPAIDLLNIYLSTRIQGYNSSSHLLTAAKINNEYGTSNTQQGLINAILDYRRSEFVHEGLRWFDILRYKIPVVHQTINGETYTLAPGDPRRVFQIPATAKQSGVEQNPR